MDISIPFRPSERSTLPFGPFSALLISLRNPLNWTYYVFTGRWITSEELKPDFRRRLTMKINNFSKTFTLTLGLLDTIELYSSFFSFGAVYEVSNYIDAVFNTCIFIFNISLLAGVNSEWNALKEFLYDFESSQLMENPGDPIFPRNTPHVTFRDEILPINIQHNVVAEFSITWNSIVSPNNGDDDDAAIIELDYSCQCYRPYNNFEWNPSLLQRFRDQLYVPSLNFHQM
ncbi:hypothetical protein Fcan01_08794 [Folsomia candida]|uniref:Uncharacterized protein n=1 Tax=Folsomia candida TaxID=158441 RepID=A0A226EFY1_FOLCA|nr:hypothetical protein Fcan01_08794 [Folsomia candida]